MPRKKPKLTKRERKSRRISFHRALRLWFQQEFRRAALTSGGIGLLVLVAFGAWFWRSGGGDAVMESVAENFYRVTAEAGLRLENVYVTRREHTTLAEVSGALGLRSGQPLLAADLDVLKEKLEQLPWVKEATVNRTLPGTLTIALTERTPVALWQKKRRLYLIDEQGVVISDKGIGEFAYLPVIVGQEAPEHVSVLYRILAQEPELLQKVAAATLVDGRQWDIRFFNGIEARLPGDEPAAAWSELAELQRSKQILDRDISTIDLRLKDRLFIRLTPTAKQTLKDETT